MFRENEIKEVGKTLLTADIEFSPKKFLTIILLTSLFFGLAVFSISLVYFKEDIYFSSVISLLTFSLLLFILKRLPKSMSKSKAEKIMSDLPIAIRSIAIQLNMKVPFEDVIKNISNWKYSCSSEFEKILREIESGESVPSALRSASNRIDSTIVKKIIVQLIRIYEGGMQPTQLKNLADELISVQKLKMKEFSAKLSFFGLLFIALSSIAPTLFLAYTMVSVLYLGTEMTPNDILLIFLVVFPLINTIIIYFIKSRTPKTLSGSFDKFFSQRERNSTNYELNRIGIKIDVKDLIIYLSVFSIVISAISLYLGYSFLSLIIFLPLIVYFVLLYKVEGRATEIEGFLPDALFQAASLEQGIPMEKIIDNLSSSGYKSLSDEFKIAFREIKTGSSVPDALNNLRERNPSNLLDRAVTLLIQCYKTGKEVQSAIRETADDVFEALSIVREREAILAMQKYTILFGGCIIVPIIIAFVLNIVSGLSYSEMEGFTKVSEDQRIELLNAANEASKIYIIIYAFLASIFVATQEGKTRKFIVYFLIFSVISSLLFSAVRGYVSIV